jgi:hypothetical protein
MTTLMSTSDSVPDTGSAEESTTGFVTPAGCARAELGACEAIEVPDGMQASPRWGWSRTSRSARKVVAADPAITCPFESPEDCEPCGNFVMTEIVIPSSITEPGFYFVEENGIEIECSGYLSSCPGFTEGGPLGCEGEDCGPDELRVIAIEDNCVVVVDPCDGGVIRAPRCGA